MPVIEVSDIDDPALEDYRDIRDRELRGRDGYPGLFVGEQPLVVERMLGIPGLTKSVLLGPAWVDRIAPRVPPEVPVYVAPIELMKRIAGAVRGFDNLFEAHSFTGRGVMQSHGVANAVADLMTSGHSSELDIAPLARERFSDPGRWVVEDLHI